MRHCAAVQSGGVGDPKMAESGINADELERLFVN